MPALNCSLILSISKLKLAVYGKLEVVGQHSIYSLAKTRTPLLSLEVTFLPWLWVRKYVSYLLGFFGYKKTPKPVPRNIKTN